MLTCNILLLWDQLEAKVLFIPKFLRDKTCYKSNILQRLPFTDKQEKGLQSERINTTLSHCNGCWSFTISVHYHLDLG